MSISKPRDSFFLFVGDIIFFSVALWLSLFVRYFRVPSGSFFVSHLLAFSLIFLIWALVFFIFNLYGKQSLIFRNKLPLVILRAQVINSIIAVVYFYLFQELGITPKTILALDLVFSFGLIFFWRWYVSAFVYRGRHEKIVVIGDGPDVEELKKELSANPGYHLEVANPNKNILPDDKNINQAIEEAEATLVVLNFKDKRIETVASDLYKLFFSKARFVDFQSLYEEVFDRVPLSLLNDQWMLENLTRRSKQGYLILKKGMDIVISVVLGIIALPFVAGAIIALKIEDSELSPFIVHERVGMDGKLVKVYKLRTMRADDRDKPTVQGDKRITPVGGFLRKSRIDELPQLWNVLTGEMSLVGPRPEMPHFVEQYKKEIPYYDVRHTITPGLSGWAQIHYYTPAYSAATNAVKLSYELYYIKNRSTLLDLKIALRTVHTLLSRKGI